jgi:hypothetical protein
MVARVRTPHRSVASDCKSCAIGFRFNAKGADGLLNGKVQGASRGPIPAARGVVRLVAERSRPWVFQEFRVSNAAVFSRFQATAAKPSARRKAMREFRIPAGTVRLKKVGSHGGIRLLILGDQHLSFNK